MQGPARINKMLKEGKISAEQADLLIRAWEESEKRRKKIFTEVYQQTAARKKNLLGGMAFGFIVVLIFFFAVLLIAGATGMVHDRQKASEIIIQGSQALYHSQLNEAEHLFRQAIRKAPDQRISYYLLATTLSELYKENNDIKIKIQADEYFQKAQELNQEGGSAMTAIGLVFLIIFIFLVFAFIMILLFSFYNILVYREEQVNESWAQVMAFYQRKLDLIPALLEAVKEYSQHEQKTLQQVTAARSQSMELLDKLPGLASDQAEKLSALSESERALGQELGRIHALVEGYPDIKANIHYETMLQQIKETEDKMIDARQDYNKKVKKYNAGLRIFPLNLIGSIFHFAKRAYYDPGQCPSIG